MASLDIKKVLLLDGIDKVCAEKLTAAGIGVEVCTTKLPKDKLMQEIKKYDAVVVRSATKLDADVLAAGAPRLQLVGRAGVGTDNIDVEAASSQGVIVMNTPAGNTISAAEHTCALICSLGRFLPLACASLKGGAWDRKAFLGSELYGKTLAIIGLGRIGREVAQRMQSFGMITIGYDPFVDSAVAAQWNIEALELEQIWPRADYITVHTPLLPHTRNLVGEQVLTKCKRGVKVVNVARGGIVDEVALLAALNSGACGGAALDVFTSEPPTDFTLCQHPKVVCTPHLGASTAEAQTRVAEEIAEQFIGAARGQPLVGLVNAQALSGGAASRPWLKLAMALGQLAAAVLGEKLKGGATVGVRCYGSKPASFARSIGSGALAGVLKEATNGAVNLINAAKIAADKGVSLTECKETSDRPAPHPMEVEHILAVNVTAGSTSTTVLGTVVNQRTMLLGVDSSVWTNGATLSDNVLVYRGALPNLVGDIASAVSNSGATCTGLSSSASPRGEVVYTLVDTTASVESVKDVSGVECVGRIQS